MGGVSLMEIVTHDKGLEQEVSSHWRRNIPGTGGVRASGLEHPLLVPGHVVAAGPAGEKAEGRTLWAHCRWCV